MIDLNGHKGFDPAFPLSGSGATPKEQKYIERQQLLWHLKQIPYKQGLLGRPVMTAKEIAEMPAENRILLMCELGEELIAKNAKKVLAKEGVENEG